MSKSEESLKSNFHPRNLHKYGYDFEFLVEKVPELEGHLFINEFEKITLDFSVSSSVRALNKALLSAHYGIHKWDIPQGYLCPPIPGRADHLHYIADLLEATLPKSKKRRLIDIGTGANVVYPLLGHKIYRWDFLATEVDSRAYKAAKQIVEANGLQKKIKVVFQKDPKKVFFGVVRRDEQFDACICNPPFHSSVEEAEKGTKRKWKNLGKKIKKEDQLNFGGQSSELIYEGGEVAFIKNIIKESRKLPHLCKWFTTLVSKKSSIKPLEKYLRSAQVKEVKIIEMGQGQKKSRILAWRYMELS